MTFFSRRAFPPRRAVVRGGARSLLLLAAVATLAAAPAMAQPAGQKPNILVIWGDDVGVHNISAYNHGITG